MSNIENVALIIDGGMGKSIMATAVVRSIKKKWPDRNIVVVSGYPDVFIHNPYIHRIFNVGNPVNFYEDYISPGKTAVFRAEPYTRTDYLHKKRHLVETWCDMIGVECDGIYPEIYLNPNERKMAQVQLAGKKPFLFIQTTGGVNPVSNKPEEQIKAENLMYRRNLPIEVAQKVVDAIKDKFTVCHVKHINHPALADVMPLTMDNMRSLFCFFPYVDKYVCIDSFLLHGAAAFGKKPVVCWGSTSPKVLGYPDHINLTREACPTPFCHRPNSYLFDTMANGRQWECQYGSACLNHDAEAIIAAINNDSKISLPILNF